MLETSVAVALRTEILRGVNAGCTAPCIQTLVRAAHGLDGRNWNCPTPDVHSADWFLMIRLNDAFLGTPQERGEVMAPLAFYQLGTRDTDRSPLTKMVYDVCGLRYVDSMGGWVSDINTITLKEPDSVIEEITRRYPNSPGKELWSSLK